MNNNESTRERKKRFFKNANLLEKLLIINTAILIFIVLSMLLMYFVNSYFLLLSQLLFIPFAAQWLVGMLMYVFNDDYPENYKLYLSVYIIIIVLSLVLFTWKSYLLRDMQAYLSHDYEVLSGEITDVEFVDTKLRHYRVMKIYIDGEEYSMQIHKLPKETFKENYGLNTNVNIKYLKNSKQIISIH